MFKSLWAGLRSHRALAVAWQAWAFPAAQRVPVLGLGQALALTRMVQVLVQGLYAPEQAAAVAPQRASDGMTDNPEHWP